MTRNPDLLILRHAAENASNEPIADEAILAILRGEVGAPSHARAVFGDASLSALNRAGASAGIPLRTILEAYRGPRRSTAGANPELDKALEGGW